MRFKIRYSKKKEGNNLPFHYTGVPTEKIDEFVKYMMADYTRNLSKTLGIEESDISIKFTKNVTEIPASLTYEEHSKDLYHANLRGFIEVEIKNYTLKSSKFIEDEMITPDILFDHTNWTKNQKKMTLLKAGDMINIIESDGLIYTKALIIESDEQGVKVLDEDENKQYIERDEFFTKIRHTGRNALDLKEIYENSGN